MVVSKEKIKRVQKMPKKLDGKSGATELKPIRGKKDNSLEQTAATLAKALEESKILRIANAAKRAVAPAIPEKVIPAEVLKAKKDYRDIDQATGKVKDGTYVNNKTGNEEIWIGGYLNIEKFKDGSEWHFFNINGLEKKTFFWPNGKAKLRECYADGKITESTIYDPDGEEIQTVYYDGNSTVVKVTDKNGITIESTTTKEKAPIPAGSEPDLFNIFKNNANIFASDINLTGDQLLAANQTVRELRHKEYLEETKDIEVSREYIKYVAQYLLVDVALNNLTGVSELRASNVVGDQDKITVHIVGRKKKWWPLKDQNIGIQINLGNTEDNLGIRVDSIGCNLDKDTNVQVSETCSTFADLLKGYIQKELLGTKIIKFISIIDGNIIVKPEILATTESETNAAEITEVEINLPVSFAEETNAAANEIPANTIIEKTLNKDETNPAAVGKINPVEELMRQQKIIEEAIEQLTKLAADLPDDVSDFQGKFEEAKNELDAWNLKHDIFGQESTWKKFKIFSKEAALGIITFPVYISYILLKERKLGKNLERAKQELASAIAEEREIDEEKYPFKHFILREMHPSAFLCSYLVEYDKATLEQINKMSGNEITEEDGKKVFIVEDNPPSRIGGNYIAARASNGYVLFVNNVKDIMVGEGETRTVNLKSEKALFSLVNPDFRFSIGAENLNYEEAMRTMRDHSKAYQDRKLKEFEEKERARSQVVEEVLSV